MPAHKQTPERLEVSFWRRVEKTDTCWVWVGSLDKYGYGTTRTDKRGKHYLAHRLAWLLTWGWLPEPPLYVLHTCDNPPCVRPDHLYVGTKKRNSQDMIERDRMNKAHQARGERVNTARLTAEQVRIIRTLDDGTVGGRKTLAALHGVTYRAIVFIVKRQHWRHV